MTPDPISDRPYVGTTGQPARTARSTSAGGIGPPPSRTARSVAGGGASRAASSRRTSWDGTSETWLGGGLDRSARSRREASPGGRTRIGTPSRIARHTTPRPATWPIPSGSAQPVAGGRTSSQASALAAIARCDSTTPFGRPVVPEVRTTTAGASGPVSAASARAGNGASTPPSTTMRRVEQREGRLALPRREPGRERRDRGAHPEERDDDGDGLGGRRHPERDAIARAHATRVHRAHDRVRATGEPRPRHPPPTVDDGQVVRAGSPRAPRRGRRGTRSCVVDPVSLERRLVDHDPEPAAPSSNGARIRPPSSTSGAHEEVVLEHARRGQAVGTIGRGPPGHVRERRGAGDRRREPDPRLEQRGHHDRDAMRRGERRRSRRPRPGPPTRAGLTTSTSAAPCSTRAAAASGEVTASSAATGTPTRARSRAAAPRAPTGSGCSTYWSTPVERPRVAPWPRPASTAPFASSRRATSRPHGGPDLAAPRSSERRAASRAPAFSLSVRNPRRGRRRRRGDRLARPTPAPIVALTRTPCANVASRSRLRRRGEVEDGAAQPRPERVPDVLGHAVVRIRRAAAATSAARTGGRVRRGVDRRLPHPARAVRRNAARRSATRARAHVPAAVSNGTRNGTRTRRTPSADVIAIALTCPPSRRRRGRSRTAARTRATAAPFP